MAIKLAKNIGEDAYVALTVAQANALGLPLTVSSIETAPKTPDGYVYVAFIEEVYRPGIPLQPWEEGRTPSENAKAANHVRLWSGR